MSSKLSDASESSDIFWTSLNTDFAEYCIGRCAIVHIPNRVRFSAADSIIGASNSAWFHLGAGIGFNRVPPHI